MVNEDDGCLPKPTITTMCFAEHSHDMDPSRARAVLYDRGRRAPPPPGVNSSIGHYFRQQIGARLDLRHRHSSAMSMLSPGPPHSGGTSEIFSSGDDRDGGAAAGSSTRFSDTCDACVPTFLSERCPGPAYQKVAVAGESRGQSPVSVNIRQC